VNVKGFSVLKLNFSVMEVTFLYDVLPNPGRFIVIVSVSRFPLITSIGL
jgi:hypothetical protein